MKSLLLGVTVAGATSALLLTGVTTLAHAATSSSEPSVLAFNQKIEGGAVTLAYVNIPSKGYAVVYGVDKDGKPIKEPLGYTELDPGDHRSIKVKLSSEPPAGSKLWVSLYMDKDGKPGFDRTGDNPVWAERLPPENQFTLQ